jgi:hypothetical protein
MADIQVTNTDADLSGNTIVTEENAYTITGLHTFDRNPNPPFAVTSGSAVVPNLDADTVDGVEAAALLRVDGSLALSANWDAGGYEIRSSAFESDVATGTAPLTVASTTLVANLNADKLDSQEGTYYLAAANATGTLAVSQGGTGAVSLTDGGVLLGSGTGAVTAMAALADGEMIVGNGTTDPVAESGATLRTSIGLGSGDSPTFTALSSGQVDVTAEGDLRLQDNSGGQYVGLDAPATVSSSYTLTLPAAVGAVNEVLSLSNVDGTLQWAASGKIRQVVYASYASEESSGSTTYSDSGLTATITPSSTSHQVLCLVAQAGVVGYDVTGGAGTGGMSIQVHRAGPAGDADLGEVLNGGASGEPAEACTVSAHILDGPGATGAVTYKTQFAVGSTGDSNSRARVQCRDAKSTMVLLEVA